MNPKNVDRIGKGILTVVGVAIVTVAKKYGPTIIKNVGEIVKKTVLKG